MPRVPSTSANVHHSIIHLSFVTASIRTPIFGFGKGRVVQIGFLSSVRHGSLTLGLFGFPQHHNAHSEAGELELAVKACRLPLVR